MAITKVTRTLLSTGIVDNSNATAITIDSSENVGIGNSSPSAQLQVGSGTDALTGTGTGQICLSGAGQTIAVTGKPAVYHRNGVGLGLYSDASMSFEINGSTSKTEAMRIDSSGNVGIGTSIPTEKLSILGGHVSVGDSTGANGTEFLLEGYRELYNAAKYGNTSIRTTYSTTTNASDMLFYTASGGTNTAEAMRIDSSGNVGVGTSSPSDYYATELVVDASDEGGISVVNGTTETGYLMFADGTSGTDRYSGYLSYDHNVDALTSRSAGYINFMTGGGTERMRIDSNGNIAIGGTSASNFSGYVTLDLRDTTGGLIDFSEAGAGVYARIQAVVNNSLNIFNRQAYPLILGTNDTERMRIDSSGRVGIGTSSPSAKLEVIHGNVSQGNGVTFGRTASQSWDFWGDSGANVLYSKGNFAIIGTSDSQDLSFRTNNTDRMRIDTSGNVLINQSSSNLTYGKLQVSAGGETAGFGGIVGFFDTDGSVASSNLIQLLAFSGDTDATGGQFIRFSDSNSTMGSVSAASGTTVSYNTSSDRRMKENIVDASSQLDVINNIQIREFDWIKNGHHEVGVIAQELNEVIPNVVQEGGEDVNEEPWGVDYGKLTPYLIKAMQEQQTIINDLKTRIETLESA